MGSKLTLKNSSNVELSIEHSDLLTKGKKVTYVDTIEQLEQLNGLDDYVCIVTDKDRGGIFLYDNSKITENDGGIVFNGWVRQYENTINVKWFGAKGDGANDGSVFITDDTESIQKAIDYSNSLGGGTIHIPKGNYTITSTIVLYPNITIYGDGTDLTEIQARPNSTNYNWIMLDIPDRGYIGTEKVNRNIELKNLSINGNDFNDNIGSDIIGLNISTSMYTKLNNIEIKMCDGNGLKILKECSNIFITTCIFRDSNSAQVVIEDSSAIFFNGGEIRTGSNFGILFENDISKNINFNGVGFVNSLYGGVHITNASKNVLIDGCTFINGGSQNYSDSAAIRVDNSDSKGIIISNNSFYLIYGKAIYFKGIDSQIVNNFIQGCRYDGIYLEYGYDVDIKDNFILDSGYYEDNVYNGIYCNSSNVNIIGNTIKTRNFTERPKYSIKLSDSATNIKIKDNDIPDIGYSTLALYVDSNSTYSSLDNKGLDDIATSVKFTSDFTVSNNSSTILTFDKIEFDIRSNWNGSSFITKTGGIYEFILSVEVSMQTNSIGPNYLYLLVQDENGVEQTRYSCFIQNLPDSSSTDDRTTFNVSAIINLKPNWLVVPKIYIDSDDNVTIDDKSYLQCIKVR